MNRQLALWFTKSSIVSSARLARVFSFRRWWPAGKVAASVAVVWIAAAGSAHGGGPSWIFRRSYFTHDPHSGQRVAQYAPGVRPYRLVDANFQKSGYRHLRSSIRGADGSADRLHVVETWGAGEYIRPYGEWLRPYRPGATPYGPWGNPWGPWTLPFDSWVNPYGLGRFYGWPRGYHGPYARPLWPPSAGALGPGGPPAAAGQPGSGPPDAGPSPQPPDHSDELD